MTAPQAEARTAAPTPSPDTADQRAMMRGIFQDTAAIGNAYMNKGAPVATSLTFDTANYVPATAYSAATISNMTTS